MIGGRTKCFFCSEHGEINPPRLKLSRTPGQTEKSKVLPPRYGLGQRSSGFKCRQLAAAFVSSCGAETEIRELFAATVVAVISGAAIVATAVSYLYFINCACLGLEVLR